MFRPDGDETRTVWRFNEGMFTPNRNGDVHQIEKLEWRVVMVFKMASLIQNWLRIYRRPQYFLGITWFSVSILPETQWQWHHQNMLLKIMDSSFLYPNHRRRLKTQMLTCLSEVVVLGGEEILMKGFAGRQGWRSMGRKLWKQACVLTKMMGTLPTSTVLPSQSKAYQDSNPNIEANVNFFSALPRKAMGKSSNANVCTERHWILESPPAVYSFPWDAGFWYPEAMSHIQKSGCWWIDTPNSPLQAVFNGNSRILKWRFCTYKAIFCGDIPLHRPYIGLI